MNSTPSGTLENPPAPHAIQLIALGAFTGILSGLFGVGGGFVIVPALVLMGVPQKRAAGISVAAILPAATVGAVGYAWMGHVDWSAAVLLALGMIVGAQLGARLLQRLPEAVLFWAFLIMLLAIIPSLWLVVPARGDAIAMSPIVAVGLTLTGLGVGMLSALLGVGGGVLIVPLLILTFHSGDLVAKGTSLVMMIPGSISATWANMRNRNVDLKAAAFIGITSCLLSPAGIWLAAYITPLQSNIGFSLLLVFTAGELVRKRVRRSRGPEVHR